MKRCPNCSRTYRTSLSFCSDDGSLLTELPIHAKSTYVPVILLAAATFGIAVGATTWWLHNSPSGSPANNQIPFVSYGSPASASSGPTISGESAEISNAATATTQVVQQPTPRTTVDVRVKYFTSAKVNDYPMPNEPIILKVETQIFSAMTNSKGVVVFSNIPCGKQVKINFAGKPSRSFSRSLKCDNQTVMWRYFFDSFAEFGPSAIKQLR